jgi:hypothetical protein
LELLLLGLGSWHPLGGINNSNLMLSLVGASKPRLLGAGARSGEREREREREAHIFKNLRERERFGSVFYIIHKNIYILMHIYI